MTEQPGEPRTLTLIEDAARFEAHRTHGYRGLVRSSEEHEGWMAGEYRVREKITRSAFRRLMAIRRAYRREAAAAPPELLRHDPANGLTLDSRGRCYYCGNDPVAAPEGLSLDVERLAQALRWEFHDVKDHPLDDKRALLAAIAVRIGYETGQPAMADAVMAEYVRQSGGPIDLNSDADRALGVDAPRRRLSPSSGEAEPERPRAINDHEERCPDCQRVILEEQRDYDAARASSGESGSPIELDPLTGRPTWDTET